MPNTTYIVCTIFVPEKIFFCVLLFFPSKNTYIYHYHPSLTKTSLLKNQLFMLLSQLLCQNVMVVS